MKIATLTMNPAIDKSSAVAQVVAEGTFGSIFLCRYLRGRGINVSRAIHKWAAILALYTEAGCQGRCWKHCWMEGD